MGKRHDAIGIKQVVRFEWMNYALDLLLAGMSVDEIRGELDQHLSTQLQSGGSGERGEQTYVKAVTQLMKSWVKPEKDLLPYRDAALQYARHAKREDRLALHWAVISAAYPFWFQIGHQVGRLLNLQEIVTQNQIRRRIFETFGERTTIERSARRVIRSFVYWGVLEDTEDKGCYRKTSPVAVTDQDLAAILIEAALHASPEGKGVLSMIQNSPAFFAFRLPTLTGQGLLHRSPRLAVGRYGLDEEVVQLALPQRR